jgi:hypothetical protein
MKEVLDYLLANDLYGVSDNVEIAKGKHELVTSFKDVKNKIIRGWKRK